MNNMTSKPGRSYTGKDLPMGSEKKDLKYQLWGWILFIVCALIFTASSIRMHDNLMLAGSLFFLAACFFFLIPLLRALKA